MGAEVVMGAVATVVAMVASFAPVAAARCFLPEGRVMDSQSMANYLSLRLCC